MGRGRHRRGARGLPAVAGRLSAAGPRRAGRRSPAAALRVAAAAALVPVAFAAATLVAGCGEPGGPQGSPQASISPTPSISAAVETHLVQTAFDTAFEAVQQKDLEAWRAALPVGAVTDAGASPSPTASAATSPDDGSESPAGSLSGESEDGDGPTAATFGVTDPQVLRQDLDGVFAHLAPLKLRAPHAVVVAVAGRPHYYSVRFTGLIARAGPPDRVLAERIVKVEVEAPASPASGAGAGAAGTGAVRIVADDTPPEVLRQNVMALNKPRVLVQDGVVLVYENAWRLRARKLAPLAEAARNHVAGMYGVDAGRPAVVFLYATRDQVTLALAAQPGQIDERIKYFSHPAPRVADRLWSPADVGVLAPALNGVEAWAPYMLQHEVAHAYTLGWFYDTAHAPDFLEEGLAVAAEDSHDWTKLQTTLAGDGLHPDLIDALALGDIWSGRKTDQVRVLYSAGGSLVDFIVQRWGRNELRRWVRQVADSDLSHEAISEITRRRFGSGWSAFEADWEAYVEKL